jgi:UDP-N-acetylglucosamine acyltransferase
MAGAHVAHDCQIGNRVILVNNAALAGHCVLEDEVIVGGLSGVHQFVRIGRGAMIGAVTMVTADVIPHGLVQGPRGTLDGLNLVGLKRPRSRRCATSSTRCRTGPSAKAPVPRPGLGRRVRWCARCWTSSSARPTVRSSRRDEPDGAHRR